MISDVALFTGRFPSDCVASMAVKGLIKQLQIAQTQGNVLTNATKHKETIVHKRFRQKLSSSGVRREADKEEEDRQVDDIKFFGCKKRDRQQKKEKAKKRADEKELM